MLIPTIILTSCVIVGAHIAADELAYTFTDGAKGIGDLLPYKWAKPVIACPTCMASVWGTASFFLFGDALLDWPIIVLACAFTNTLFNKWVN
jgi:hypothetical protein